MPMMSCAICKKDFHVPAYRSTTARFCSTACMAIEYRTRPAFYTPPTRRVICTCETCGTNFEVIASRLTHGRGRHCSPKCQYISNAQGRPGTRRQTYSCLACGKVCVVRASTLHAQKGAGKYCSRRCRDQHRVGVNHPMFIHGSSSNFRGPNWQAQKRKAKHRDSWICQECGIGHIDSLARNGQGLQVHHIQPFRLFASYIEANDLSNLRTLCPMCHRIAEAVFQAAERTRLPKNPM